MNITSKLVGAGLALAGAISLSAMTDTAQAGSITQPGELVGYTWAPLPEGLFFATTASYGNNRGGASYASEAAVNVPVIIWSTPWHFLGARVEAYAAVPSELAGTRGPAGGTGSYLSAIYNPYANVGLAWDLGHGIGFSSFVGGYAPVNNVLAHDFWTFNWRNGITWAPGDGYSLSAHVVLGITGNNLNTGVGVVFPGVSSFGLKTFANYINYDLAATKTIGKWTFGAVGYGSFDISGTSFIPGTTPFTGYQRQSQFAVGGLLGYDFGPVILTTYLTHDVYEKGYLAGGVPIAAGTPFALTVGSHPIYETRFWTRLVVPLWVAPAPAPVVAKY